LFVPRCRGERIAQLSFFFLRRSFFAVRAGLADSGIGLQRDSEPKLSKSGSSVTLANEVERSNILAPGLWFRIRGTPLLPAFTVPRLRDDWPWEVVSSYSSATAPDLHGISRADPLFQARKELPSGLAARGRRLKHKSGTWIGRLCHVERRRLPRRSFMRRLGDIS
jgi:hypothetical protein